jgi:septum site-determining protein MinC
MSETLPALDASAQSVLRMDDQVLVLVVPAGPTFDEIREWIREALPVHKDRIAGQSLRIDVGDRPIALFDLRRLIHLLRDEYLADVTGLYVRPGEIHRYAERELKLKLFPTEPAPKPALIEEPPEVEVSIEAPTEEDSLVVETLVEAAVVLESDTGATPGEPATNAEPIPADPVAKPDPEAGRRTLSVHRTLRSGASVKFDGDVILFGDVNAGAQIVAAGNIVVLGSLRGMAHAGATGDESAFILGSELRPTQIRIGRKIAIPPERKPDPSTSGTEIARVLDGEIQIETWRGKNRS